MQKNEIRTLSNTIYKINSKWAKEIKNKGNKEIKMGKGNKVNTNDLQIYEKCSI